MAKSNNGFLVVLNNPFVVVQCQANTLPAQLFRKDSANPAQLVITQEGDLEFVPPPELIS